MASESTPDELKERLARAVKSKAVLAERSKRLQEQADDLRRREDVIANITTELLDRQRELNLMLHRANSFVHQLRDANLALSSEFKELVKELPAAQDSNWDSMVSRVNELFEKTHELAGEMEDELFLGTPSERTEPSREPEPAEQVSGDRPPYEAPSGSPPVSDAGVGTEAPASEEPRAEPAKSGAEAPPDPVLSHEERMDQILTKLRSDEQGRTEWQPSEKAPDEGKSGFFSRIFGRNGD